MLKYIVFCVLSFFMSTVNAEDVLATFGGSEKITKTDLKEYVSSRIDFAGTFKNSYTVENSLNEMIFARLLVLEGVEKSMPRPEKKAADERYDDRYGFSVFRAISMPCLPLKNKEEERKYFEEHPEVFRSQANVRLFRYMLPKKQMIEAEDATSKMVAWAKAWGAKKITLDQIESEASKLFNTEVQGDIGWLQLSDEIELMRTVGSAKTGELVGPVDEGDFVYLFYVAGKQEARQLLWDEVANDIAKMADSFCTKKNIKNIKNNLYSKYDVKINKENIRKIFLEK